MYLTFVTIHSLLRWAIVIVAVLAVLAAAYGFFAKPKWPSWADMLGSTFTWVVRINLLLGIVLWIWLLSAAPFNVFYHLIHPLFMFAGLALAEILAARRRREREDADKWRLFLLGTLLPTILIFAAIPWDR